MLSTIPEHEGRVAGSGIEWQFSAFAGNAFANEVVRHDRDALPACHHHWLRVDADCAATAADTSHECSGGNDHGCCGRTGCSTVLQKAYVTRVLGVNRTRARHRGAFHRLFSRLITGLDLTGRFPGLQPQDPLVPITDPANMAPDAPPALQAAAAAKEEEDSAKQKIMALRYLATLGCGGCYEKVEEGLLSALDDCTEEVRFEAVSALRGKSAYNCRFCKSSRCCSDKIRRKLNEVAYDVDVNGCYKEPSARVRRVARLALAACCGPVYSEGETIPSEGPPDPEAPAGPVEEPAVALGEPPPLFEGIQLVRFETDAQAILGTDPLLAQVDGEPIYESHVRVVVDARLAALKQSPIISTDDARWRQLMPLELQRLITWKLLYIEARKELRAPGSASANMPLSAAEVQQWFQWRTSGDPNISPKKWRLISNSIEVSLMRQRECVGNISWCVSRGLIRGRKPFEWLSICKTGHKGFNCQRSRLTVNKWM